MAKNEDTTIKISKKTKADLDRIIGARSYDEAIQVLLKEKKQEEA